LLRRGTWPSEAALFALVLGVISQFFSLKMSRLMILMGPASSVLAGCTLGGAFDCAVSPIWRSLEGPTPDEQRTTALRLFNFWPVRIVRLCVAAAGAWIAAPYALEFHEHCLSLARWTFSHARIVTKDRQGNLNDEIREAYWWLRDRTPQDTRVLAWWDYGYQIAGVANRTTLADGNTWNMEHIGLVGMAMSAPLPEGHRIVRHLADYVLFWRDDVGKSGHMARIANSAFPGHCEEATCDQFGVFRNGTPAPMMRDSLVWYVNRPGSGYDPEAGKRFYETVHVSAQSRVRIAKVHGVSQESKAWAADPRNRRCDAQGSWYCPGRYPPPLRQMLGWDDVEEGNGEAALHRAEYEQRVRRQQAATPGPHGPSIPEGSYLDSCSGCRMEGSGAILVCARCVSPGSASSGSRLALGRCGAQRLVDNIQGELECKPEANAAGIPPGGYAHSCLGCKLEDGGSMLSCSHCGTKQGSRRSSAISLSRCAPPAAVDNQDGQLVCVGLANGAGIPDGPYTKSCQGCVLEGDSSVLRCAFCAGGATGPVEASYELSRCPSPGKLENGRGKLVCIGKPHALGVPQGGYLKSCHGCLVESGTLSCEGCRAADGRWLPTSLALSGCVGRGRVDNANGRLACK